MAVIDGNARVGKAKIYTTAKEMKLEKENQTLQARIDNVLPVISAWDRFETDQIAKDGPYAGDKINSLIAMTRAALKRDEILKNSNEPRGNND